jgi:hypothetical protein
MKKRTNSFTLNKLYFGRKIEMEFYFVHAIVFLKSRFNFKLLAQRLLATNNTKFIRKGIQINIVSIMIVCGKWKRKSNFDL